MTENEIATVKSDATRLAFEVRRTDPNYSHLHQNIPDICIVCIGLCSYGKCCYDYNSQQAVRNKFYWHSLPETPLEQICRRFVSRRFAPRKVLTPAEEYA